MRLRDTDLQESSSVESVGALCRACLVLRRQSEVSYEALNRDDDPFNEGESSSLIASPLSPELIKAELCNWKLESKEINQVYKLASRLVD